MASLLLEKAKADLAKTTGIYRVRVTTKYI
jgi:hypothetical protein